MSAEQQKRAAAERAVDEVRPGMRVGLGTGSTARHVLDVIGERLKDGRLSDLVGVATSRATADYASTLGIPLSTLDETPALDIAIDGADEVDPNLDLIKGLGGALLWEKIVESAAERLIIVVDESKLVERLGMRGPLPVEVIPLGWRTHEGTLAAAGATTELRLAGDGTPFVTDGGHYILDARFEGGIRDAHALQRTLDTRVGIVETGLFLDMASAVVVAGEKGVRVMERTT